MMFVMLVAGIGLVLAGLLAIGYGIPIKEFSTGNTLIIAGVIGVCTGAIMLGLWVAVRELKNIARRSAPARPKRAAKPRRRPVLPPPLRGMPPPPMTAFRQPSSSAIPTLRVRAAPPFRAGGPAAVAERGRAARSPDSGAAAPGTAAAGRETEAQSAVFIDIAKGARARPGAVRRAAAAGSAVVGPSPQAAGRAAGRNGRTAAGIVRRCLAESGAREALARRRRRGAAAACRRRLAEANAAPARPRISPR